MRLVLVRHGETPYNKERRILGQSEIGLTPEGHRQAEAIAATLRGTPAHALYASPLRRAMETAEPLARALNLAITPAPGLVEVDVGTLDGCTGEEMRRQYPEFAEWWQRDVASAVMPGGESLEQLQTRAWATVQQMAQSHPQGTVVAVTHNFTIAMLLCKALDLPIPLFRRLRIQVASMTTLEDSTEGWDLVGLNDTCHLDTLSPITTQELP